MHTLGNGHKGLTERKAKQIIAPCFVKRESVNLYTMRSRVRPFMKRLFVSAEKEATMKQLCILLHFPFQITGKQIAVK